MVLLEQMRRSLQLALLVVLSGLLAAGGLGQAQSQESPVAPEVRDWARILIEQLGVAIREAVFTLPAPDMRELQLRAARVLNVLVGKQSPDHQTRAGDPLGADGVGVLTYVERLRNAIEPRAQTNERLRPVLFTLNLLQLYQREALERLREMLRGSDDGAARRASHQVLAFLVAARGSNEDPLSEGGGARALLLYLNRL
jgi:hypothetical protein